MMRVPRPFLVLTCLILVTSADRDVTTSSSDQGFERPVILSDHLSWPIAQWIQNFGMVNIVRKLQELVEAIQIKLKYELREELREEFSLQNKCCDKSENIQDIVDQIHSKIADLDAKIIDIQNNSLAPRLMKTTETPCKEGKECKLELYKDVMLLNTAMDKLSTKHLEYDNFHQEIKKKQEEIDNIQLALKNHLDAQQNQVTQNTNALNEFKKLNDVAINTAVEKLTAETMKSIEEQKKEFASLLDKLKVDVVRILNARTHQSRKQVVELYSSFLNLEMIELGTNLYHISKNQLPWHEAQTFCRSHGLELAAPVTEQEYRPVLEHWVSLSKKGTDFNVWLGATNEGGDGRWRWSAPNRPFAYTNWWPQQPDNNVDNCARVCSNTLLGGTWCNVQCTYHYFFICQLI